jgi:hypothetical protein
MVSWHNYLVMMIQWGGIMIDRLYPIITLIVACVTLLLGFGLFGGIVFYEWGKPIWKGIVFDHFVAVWGTPGIGLAAIIVVALFRTVEGQIKITIPGFTFEGASGPIIMWTMVFLAWAGVVKLLWDCTTP